MTDNNNYRYSVTSNEDFQPGTTEGVLKNYLGIIKNDVMEELEERELERAILEILEKSYFDNDHQFTSEDICNIHELWLGDIYPFAGKYRTVNIEKDGYLFAASSRIDTLMMHFEKEILSKYTPCHCKDLDDLALALGIVHVELILIHPFRDGNGRIARLLADLMSMQANQSPLNYIKIDQTYNLEGYKKYIQAIQAGISENYVPIKEIFKQLLNESGF